MQISGLNYGQYQWMPGANRNRASVQFAALKTDALHFASVPSAKGPPYPIQAKFLGPQPSYHILDFLGHLATTQLPPGELLGHIRIDKERQERNAEVNPEWWEGEVYKHIIAPEMKAAVGNVEGLKLLDMGSGKGGLTISFAERNAKEVIGVDFVEKNIRLSQENLALKNAERAAAMLPPLTNIHFYEASSSDLSGLKSTGRFDNASFDKIYSTMVFHGSHPHVYDGSVDEAFRLLKPGGEFTFIVKHPHLHRTHGVQQNIGQKIFSSKVFSSKVDTKFLEAFEHTINRGEHKPTRGHKKRRHKTRRRKPNVPVTTPNSQAKPVDTTTVYTHHMADYLVPLYKAGFAFEGVCHITDLHNKDDFPCFLLVKVSKPNAEKTRFLKDQKQKFEASMREQLKDIPMGNVGGVARYSQVGTVAVNLIPALGENLDFFHTVVRIFSQRLDNQPKQSVDVQRQQFRKFLTTLLPASIDNRPLGARGTAPRKGRKRPKSAFFQTEASFRKFLRIHYRRATGENLES